MHQKVKIRLSDGREIEAAPVDITQASEQWNQYLLEDGSVLKIKLVATKIVRLDDEFDLEGNPVYSVQSTNVLSVEAPAHLKRKGV